MRGDDDGERGKRACLGVAGKQPNARMLFDRVDQQLARCVSDRLEQNEPPARSGAVHRRLTVFEAQRKWALERRRGRAEQVNRMEVFFEVFANRKGLRVRQCENHKEIRDAFQCRFAPYACEQYGLENRQDKRVILQQFDESGFVESTERLDSLRIAENVGKKCRFCRKIFLDVRTIAG